MKSKITSGLFTSRTDEWSTPQRVYDELNKEFNFDLDCAASEDNAKFHVFFTKEDSALSKDWSKYKNIFLNPPYSGNLAFLKKASAGFTNTTIVVLSPCRTDTKWWHQYAMKADEIRLIQGRLKYNDSKNSAPFPSCIIIFRPLFDSKLNVPIIKSIKF